MSSAELELTRLYRAHRDDVYGLLLTRTGDASVAEELLAQTFEAAATHFARNPSTSIEGGWLITVARRRLVDHWRAKRRRGDLVEALAGRPDTAPPPDTDPGMWSALDSLPWNQRAALVLRYVDDWSVSEVADGLGVSYRAAESLLSRARRSVAAALERDGYRDD